MGDVMVPILKDNKDPHYRYKMPKLTAKVEGSGNGIRTVITNMSAIAKALDRPPTYPTKFFGCELGAQVTMNNEFVVNGSHDPEKLMSLLYTFIAKFVLCAKCKNPETSLTVSNQTIRQKCIACGHDVLIPKTLHKLTTFIINHPPDGSNPLLNGTSSGKGTKAKSEKSKGSKSKKNATTTSSNGQNGSNSPTNDSGDNGNNGNGSNNDDEDGFDEDELTADAYTERMKELRGDGVNTAMYLNDSKESANLFYKMVKEKKEANQLSDIAVHKELVKEAERLEIKDKSTLVLSELLFSENILEEIKQHRLLLLRFCNENKKAQKYLLGGFEKLVGDVYKDKLFNNAMKILKQFYDEDIVEEETIIEWAAKSTKKYVSKDMSKKIREKVDPFVKWLKEAEVEDDDDEEEEDENKNIKIKGKETNGGGDNKPAVNNHGHNNAKEGGNENQRKSSLDDDENDEDDDDLFEFSHRVSGIHIESVKPAAVPKAVNADVVGVAATNGQTEDDIDIDQI